ncbi:hypothetical protein [Streptomyces sp. NPDC054765]
MARRPARPAAGAGMVALARMRPDDAEQYLQRQLAAKAAKFLPAASAADHPSPGETA